METEPGQEPWNDPEPESAPMVAPQSTHERIRQAVDLETETVEIPEWGVTLTVRGLARGEVRALPTEASQAEIHAWHLGVVDPAFTLEEAEEILTTKSFSPTERVLTKILELSGLGDSFRP
jgi:hypothetical protein